MPILNFMLSEFPEYGTEMDYQEFLYQEDFFSLLNQMEEAQVKRLRDSNFYITFIKTKNNFNVHYPNLHDKLFYQFTLLAQTHSVFKKKYGDMSAYEFIIHRCFDFEKVQNTEYNRSVRNFYIQLFHFCKNMIPK